MLGLGLILLLEYAALMNLSLSPYLGASPGNGANLAKRLDLLPLILALLGSLFGVAAGLLFGPLGRARD